jgi:hypothetical protein
MWFKGVELSKEGTLVLGSVLDRIRATIERKMMRSSVPVLEPKIYDQAHSTYTRVFHVTLATIANLLALWDFQSSYVCSSALPSIKRI